MSTRRLQLPFKVAGIVTALSERPGLGGPLPLRWQRRWLELASLSLPQPRGTVIRAVSLGGRPALRVSVGATERPNAIVHLHGGAYTVGSPTAYRSMAAYLAEASGAVVYLPDYRLAPENPYPAALDDAVAACRSVADLHEAFALSGDSAGGGLAVATARRLIDRGAPRPGALTLASPWVDPTARAITRKRDLIVRESWGIKCAEGYVGTADPHDPGIAPIYGSLIDMPPTLVHVCRTEVLYDQVSTFVESLLAADVDATLTVQRLWHAGIAQAGLVADAHQAVTEFGEFVKKQLG